MLVAIFGDFLELFSPAGSFRFQHPCPTLRFVFRDLVPSLGPPDPSQGLGSVGSAPSEPTSREYPSHVGAPRAYPSLPSLHLLSESSSRRPDCFSYDGLSLALRNVDLLPQGDQGVQCRAEPGAVA